MGRQRKPIYEVKGHNEYRTETKIDEQIKMEWGGELSLSATLGYWPSWIHDP